MKILLSIGGKIEKLYFFMEAGRFNVTIICFSPLHWAAFLSVGSWQWVGYTPELSFRR